MLVYDRTDFSYITSLKEADSHVQSVYADKEFIYAAGEDNKVQIYNRKDFSLVTELNNAKNKLLSVYADNYNIYAGGRDSNVQVYSKKDFSYITELTESSNWVWAIYTDDEYIYTTGYDCNIQIYSKKDFSLIKEIKTPGYYPQGEPITINVDDNYIYTGGQDDKVYIYNKQDYSLEATLTDAVNGEPTGGDVHSVIPYGRRLYTAGYNNNVFIYRILPPIPPISDSFSVEYGTTNFSATDDLTNITNLTLANEKGTIQFPEDYSVDTDGEDYDLNIKIGDNFISVNSEELNPSFNSTSTLTINNINCSVFEDIYYSEEVLSSNEEILAQGQICNETSNPSCTNITCEDSILTFTVSHFTSFGVKETIIEETPKTSPPTGSGGGGGSSSNKCYSDCWTCTSWQGCVNGLTTRTCTTKEDYDSVSEEKPVETFACTTEKELKQETTQETETQSKDIAPPTKGITAQAVLDVINNKTTQKIAVYTFALALAITGCFFRFKKFKK